MKKFEAPKLNQAETVVLAAIALNHFSYWPSIVTDRSDNSGLELAMLSGVVLVIYTLWKFRQKFIRSILANKNWWWLIAWLVYGVVLSLTLTSEHSINILRSGYLLSIAGGSYTVFWLFKNKKIKLDHVMRGWIVLALASVIIALLQFALEAGGVASLIRPSYAVGTFSFPRVHGFSFEPLFYANWLIAPFAYAVYLFVKSKVEQTHRLVVLTLAVAIFLTLSRGAFVALAAGSIVWLILDSRLRTHVKQLSLTLSIALVATLALVGVASQMNNDRFFSGIGRYLDHATFGVFNQEGASNIEPVVVEKSDGTKRESFAPTKAPDKQGVVEASTKGRLETSEYAIDIWQADASNTVFGVGLFRYGEELSEEIPELFIGTKQVSNNQYLDILVETGLVGFSLLAIFGWTVFRKLREIDPWLLAAFVALCVQFISFSGYFLIPFWVVLAIILSGAAKRKAQ